MDTLEWIENWYRSQCDGDWEHGNVIKIESLDNPGWSIKIDLTDTDLQDLVIEYKLVEGDEVYVDAFGTTQTADWYGFAVEDRKYDAIGDPGKLQFLLETFRRLVEEHPAA